MMPPARMKAKARFLVAAVVNVGIVLYLVARVWTGGWHQQDPFLYVLNKSIESFLTILIPSMGVIFLLPVWFQGTTGQRHLALFLGLLPCLSAILTWLDFVQDYFIYDNF